MAETDLPLEASVDEIIARHAHQPGALLPVLHAIQDAFGHIDPAHVGRIAEVLNLSRAEVHGVISFYQAMHCELTEQHAKERLGVDYGGTSEDGVFTLAATYCLGNCAAAPSMMVGEKLYGRVTPQRLDEVLADWRNRS